MSKQKNSNSFYIYYILYSILHSTFAHSEGQAWLWIAALTTIHRSSKFCFKYLNRSNKYVMTIILPNGDHRTFI